MTVAGQPYPHLLFQLILSHSGWRYAEVAAGETFLALKQGMQNAPLGGVPEVVRSDNTSAATHEMKRIRGRALNDNYAAPLRPSLHPHQSRQEPRKRGGQLTMTPSTRRSSRDFHTASAHSCGDGGPAQSPSPDSPIPTCCSS